MNESRPTKRICDKDCRFYEEIPESNGAYGTTTGCFVTHREVLTLDDCTATPEDFARVRAALFEVDPVQAALEALATANHQGDPYGVIRAFMALRDAGWKPKEDKG